MKWLYYALLCTTELLCMYVPLHSTVMDKKIEVGGIGKPNII